MDRLLGTDVFVDSPEVLTGVVSHTVLRTHGLTTIPRPDEPDRPWSGLDSRSSVLERALTADSRL